MQTTLKEQIEAIQKSMTERKRFLNIYYKKSDYTKDDHWKALNDAASTIAAVQLAPCMEWTKIQAEKDPLV